MHDGSDMILTETPKEKIHLSFLLLDGRADGWDYGYSCAAQDMNGGPHA